MNRNINRLHKIFLRKKDLYYKLILSIGLLFVFPAFGFLFFAVKYNIIEDRSLPLFLAGFLLFSFFGFIFLRAIFRKITRISEELYEKVATDVADVHLEHKADELGTIVSSFNALEQHLKATVENLNRKASEISTLKELSDLCYVTFDTDELLYVTLERALKLVKADIGSVLILERPQRKTFLVQAHIGVDNTVKVGSRIDFDTSIAKYAVINKSPLLVEDIEKDSRFGRNNKTTYATKSFICMPLKTIGDIIGVLTISRKNEDKIFTQDDVEVLTPLLSNAAFTYENIRLFKENELGKEIVKTTVKIFKTINSSLRDSELMYSVLHEIQSLISYDLAVVMVMDDNHPDDLMIYDIQSRGPINLTKGSYYPYKGTIFDKVIQQEATLLVMDTGQLTHAGERELLVNQYSGASLMSALRISGEIKGVLILCSPNKDSLNKDLEFVEVAKDGVAFALERTRLSASVTRRSQEFDTLKQIGAALAASTFDIDQVLKYAMDMIRVTMDVEAGSLLLLRGEELEFKVSFDIDAAALGQATIKMGQGIAGYVASQGKAITVNDVRQSPHFFPAVDNTTGFVTKSALCVPMISKGKVIGVIELLNKRSGDFSNNDEQLLQSITSSLIIAIENARLYRETVSMTEHERGIRQIFQKFVPKEVVDKIIHGEATGKPLLDEFRTLTFLNIDIRGFSRLAKTIGPHKTVPMINYFFSIMGEIVFRHQGIVDKYLGDGFLALFGAPVSSVSDADNAIAASLDMKKAIDPVSDYFLKEVGAPLFMGVAIHTGEAVIGNIGFEKKMDYTVIGDAVNTVFRLQDIVKPLKNGIIISERTRRTAQSSLATREIGEYEIDAALEKVKVYELLNQMKV